MFECLIDIRKHAKLSIVILINSKGGIAILME